MPVSCYVTILSFINDGINRFLQFFTGSIEDNLVNDLKGNRPRFPFMHRIAQCLPYEHPVCSQPEERGVCAWLLLCGKE